MTAPLGAVDVQAELESGDAGCNHGVFHLMRDWDDCGPRYLCGKPRSPKRAGRPPTGRKCGCPDMPRCPTCEIVALNHMLWGDV